MPDVGRTFRFNPTPEVQPQPDASVKAVFSLAQSPGFFANPVPVSALISNTGNQPLFNLPVTLTVTGANPYTETRNISSLAVGSQSLVSFTYSPTDFGQSTLTVSVPNDANDTNNSRSVSQQIVLDAFSYADSSAITGQVGYGTAQGLLLARYRLSMPNTVLATRICFANNPASVGRTVYAVLLDSLGTVRDRSPNYVIQAADLGQYRSLFMESQPRVRGVFYVGLAQLAASPAYFPLATQTETPTRFDGYYSGPLNGGEIPTVVNTFGRFMIQAVLGTQVPVELVAFTARKSEQGVELAWRTASEQNNAGFEVERKSEGAIWNTLGFVRGNGTTTEAQSYSFIDRTATGKVQYRLKQLDFDGQFEYSPVIEVDAGLPKTFVLEQNYPNPFNPTTIINYQLPTASTVSLKVYDVLGKEVATLVNGRQAAGSYNFNFNASTLASGVYFYRLQASATNGASGSNFVETKKMMLVK
ncbi:MAG: T9SS type A sorting domain-containing protein [Chloroherpetonaceae bacterium]